MFMRSLGPLCTDLGQDPPELGIQNLWLLSEAPALPVPPNVLLMRVV